MIKHTQVGWDVGCTVVSLTFRGGKVNAGYTVVSACVFQFWV